MKNIYVLMIVILIIVVAGLSIYSLELRGDLIKLTKEENNMPKDEKNEEKIIKIEEGLTAEILTEGSGEIAKEGDTVIVHYEGVLEDGSLFDSSIQRGKPFPFDLGSGTVIPGWEKGVVGMKVGEKRRLTISSDLAYGDRGISTPDGKVIIPGKATLIFEIELLGIE